MGKLFNILAFLLILLFIVGVSWLGYQSYEHMKAEAVAEEMNQELGADYVSDGEEDADADWDEDEDLLDDDEVAGAEETEDDELEAESDLNAEELLAALDEDEKDETEDEVSEGVGGIEVDLSNVNLDETEEANDRVAEFNKMVNLSPSDLFYVIVGSFTVAENADFEVAAMKKRGYTDTETVQFASTKYLSVSAGRFKTQDEARQLAEKIKNDLKIDVYVHKRRFK